jgi:hypothetical protein
VRRVVLFAKGNVDVHDSLHSCRIGGEVLWNGINELVRDQAGVSIRLRHETWTRSDAILEATGAVPAVMAERALALGSYPVVSQFSAALVNTDADAVILSILGDTATALFRHRQAGFAFYPANAETWTAEDRRWFSEHFTRVALLSPEQSIKNISGLVESIRMHSDAPILVYNVSSIIPGEAVHNFQGIGETYATRCKRFNLELIKLSEEAGISIVDVDTIVARAGAETSKIDAMHLTPKGYKLVAQEVARILRELGVLPVLEDQLCAPV